MTLVGYANGKFLEGSKMFKKIDRAAIEATLGRGVQWVDEEESSDVQFLFDKSIREGLSAEEQNELDCLIALYESGR